MFNEGIIVGLPVFKEFTNVSFVFCPFIISCFAKDMYEI